MTAREEEHAWRMAGLAASTLRLRAYVNAATRRQGAPALSEANALLRRAAGRLTNLRLTRAGGLKP